MTGQLENWIDHCIAMDAPELQAIIRLFLALVAGGLIGIERELRGRQAGFRTNILVCLGSALAMIVSIHMMSIAFPSPTGRDDIRFQVDPARIAYGVMTGVGFLGAGAIMHLGPNVRGLTTAAGLWCVAAIGLCLGAGLYSIALAAAVFVLMVLWLFQWVESDIGRKRLRRLTLRCPYHADCLDAVTRRLGERGHGVQDHTLVRDFERKTVDVTVTVAFKTHEDSLAAERELLDDPEMTLIQALNG